MTALSSTVQVMAKERGMSISALADKMGVNRKTLYSCIHGNPRLSSLQSIADALNVRLSDILAIPEDVEDAAPQEVPDGK
ncbi:helix-turn-helix domain-containing protein [Klebsiella michiganensis]|uniref:helix-turn-helix domain-containing protein n=1 Tax=Klebsiella michiganensis TaxID=1134687 RepID=UPI000667E729|nr:helix-turn-helix transcriptional regulator [Klebsiella michiganensis]